METKQYLTTEIGDLEKQWTNRNNRIKEYYDLRNLVNTIEQRDNFDYIISNLPSTFFRLSKHIMCKMPPRHRIPIETDDEKELVKQAKSERTLTSLYREKDAEYIRRGRSLWRRYFVDILLSTGWYAVFAAVLPDPDDRKKPKFVAEVWTPQDTYPRWDDSGLSQCAHIYKVDKRTLESKVKTLSWKLPAYISNKKEFIIKDYYERTGKEVKNATLVDDIVVRELTVIDMDSIPILVGGIGEAGWGGQYPGDTQWDERFGQSILEPNRIMYDNFNKWLTMRYQITRYLAEPIMATNAPGGKVLFDAKLLEERRAKVISLDVEASERIGFVVPPPMPTQVTMLDQELLNMIYQGSIPPSMYGHLPFEISGFAIEKLMTGALASLGEHHEIYEAVISEIDYTWINQYKEGNFDPIKIAGRKLFNRTSSFFSEEYSTKDVPEFYYVDATIPLAMPSNLMEKLAAARQARPIGNILDLITVLDEIVQSEDPQMIEENLRKEETRQHPVFGILKTISAMKNHAGFLREKGDEKQAKFMEQMATQLAQSIGLEEQKGYLPPPKPTAPMGAMTPEAMGQSRQARRTIAGEVPPQQITPEGGM